MPENAYEFNTPKGETIARELLIAYLNVGERESPKWAALGKRVEDSSAEYDWGEESVQDVLGNTYTTLKKPMVTQSFDPLPLDADDTAARKIWEYAIRDQNPGALANMDMLIAHFYAGDESKNFAERYSSCAVRPTSLGGDGGGTIAMPTDITYGGTRTVGSVSKAAETGDITFTEDKAA